MSKNKKNHKSYSINQSVFFRLNSKKKLSRIIGIDLSHLKSLASGESNYSVFTIEGGKCNLTGKILKPRTIQNPKPDLKRVQKKIQIYLSRISAPIYNHGASVNKSYKTNAEAHSESESVATFDITSFFENTKRSKVFGFFYKKLECSSDVADLLTNLCTFRGALATGSPVSPIISFWSNIDMFETINKKCEGYGLNFTLYIDDITVSGALIPKRLRYEFSDLLNSHGYRISPNKTRIFVGNKPRHITGLVISQGKLRVPHSRFKKLRVLQSHLHKETLQINKIKLMERICGLAGEASYIDDRYVSFAIKNYEKLREMRG